MLPGSGLAREVSLVKSQLFKNQHPRALHSKAHLQLMGEHRKVSKCRIGEFSNKSAANTASLDYVLFHGYAQVSLKIDCLAPLATKKPGRIGLRLQLCKYGTVGAQSLWCTQPEKSSALLEQYNCESLCNRVVCPKQSTFCNFKERSPGGLPGHILHECERLELHLRGVQMRSGWMRV